MDVPSHNTAVTDLKKIKKKLKEWESAFFTVHQRKPEKDDIDNAPDNIKALYRTYHAARRTSQSSSTEQRTSQESNKQDRTKTENNNSKPSGHQEAECSQMSVWGPEFNKKPVKSAGSKSSHGSDKQGGSTLLNKLGDKLFARCSKTPASVSKKKSFLAPRAKSMETSQQHVQDAAPSSSSSLHSKGTNMSTSSSAVSEGDEFRVTGEIFEKAFRLSTGKRPGNLDDEDVPKKFQPGRPRRQFSLGRNLNQEDGRSSGLDSLSQSLDEGTSDFSQFDVGPQESDVFCVSNKGELQSHSFQDVGPARKQDSNKTVSVLETTAAILNNPKDRIKRTSTKTSQVLKAQTAKIDAITSTSEASEKPQTYKTRAKRKKASSQKSTLCEETAGTSEQASSSVYIFAGDEVDGYVSADSFTSKKTAQPTLSAEDSDGEGESIRRKGKKEGKALARGRKRVKKDDDADHMGDDDDETPVHQPESPKKPAKRRKTSGPTGLTSARKTDNFVRLNMKAKKFVRKGSRMTGGQWKRKQWQQKMAARAKSYGDRCFKCGQSGHWANKCPGSGSGSHPSLQGDITPVDEQDFPSLRSAALMARGIKRDDIAFEADDELAVEAMVLRERHESVVQHTPVTPFSQLVTDEEEEIQKGLNFFGYTSFKQGQKETVTRILNGESTLVILSTGGGKSLCYQLPAYLYAQQSRGITLVVSPLVSLMEDQVTGLPPGVRGACLNSNMTPAQRNNVLSDVNAGKVHFLLVSPEAVVGGGGRGQGSFPSSDKLPPIFFACIDEVHCLSEWSHNFRPSYLRLCKVLREKYGVSCFLGLTATATKSTAADVARHLGIVDMDAATVRGSPVPPNLCLSVSRDENRSEALRHLLQGKRFSSCSSIIIYCTRRQQVERVASLIRTCLPQADSQPKPKGKGSKSQAKQRLDVWSVESYHAGLTPAERKRVQKGFMSGMTRVVVATVAFGMGLDKADVRGIVHFDMPKSFENYVQEIGRAGRDGQLSHCHLFLDPSGQDVAELQRHTFGNSVDRHTLKKLLQRVFTACRCQQVQELQGAWQMTDADGEAACEAAVVSDSRAAAYQVKRACPGHERALITQQLVSDLDVREEGIMTLLCYLELHTPQLLSNLSPVYATCHLQCYGGPTQLQAVAKKCPPVAVAIAKQKMLGKSFGTCNSVKFPVVEVSDSMGWDSGPVKRELTALQWAVTEEGAKKSGVMVSFTDLALRIQASGDVSDQESDALLDFLHERVTRQERREITQLALFARRLKDVSHKNYWMCTDEADQSRSDLLKRHLDDHFDDISDDNLIAEIDASNEQEVDASTMSQLTSDIQRFIQLYGNEHSLTGRAVARVMHGIDSPRYPATTWGRVSRFWRAQLHVHFNVVIREATKQLLQLR